MTWELHRHDARRISELLEPDSVDLICCSPPYFALRSYRDDGEHFADQLGSEATPTEFVDNLIACTADWLKVLKPTGSLFVNLSDKYSGSGGPGGDYNRGGLRDGQPREDAQSYWARMSPANNGIPAKSRMGLPWRYAIRCIDELGLILRADIVWAKPNGLPESVTDRVRISHEYLFHFTRQGRYFAAIDEVREASNPDNAAHSARYNEAAKTYGKTNNDRGDKGAGLFIHNPLGKVPGSVWTIPSEPLTVPDHLGVDHFAAFPSELPRRIILGWCPEKVCSNCARPLVEFGHESRTTVVRGMPRADHGTAHHEQGHEDSCAQEQPILFEGVLIPTHGAQSSLDEVPPPHDAGLRRGMAAHAPDDDEERLHDGAPADHGGTPRPAASTVRGRPSQERRQDGQPHREPRTDAEEGARQAPEATAETVRLPPLRRDDAIVREPLTCPHCGGREFKPGVVADFFVGTGTTPAVAHLLGRHGIGTDLSADYLRLAEWRCSSDQRLRDKVLDRSGIPNPDPPKINGQLDLFGGVA